MPCVFWVFTKKLCLFLPPTIHISIKIEMQTEQKVTVGTEILFAVLIALIHFGWITAEYYLGLNGKFKDWYGNVTNFVAIPVIYMTYKAMLAKRDNEGTISLERAALSALILAGITAVLIPLSYWLFRKYINPTFFDDFAKFATDVQKMDALKAIDTYSLRHFAKWGFLHALLIVGGTGLMTAVVMRKRA
ncbi:MAG: hypothetical protein RL329_1614 [Bacteroidota bacterium]|jgi:hypothetical protein